VSFRPFGLSLSKPLFAHHPLESRHRPLRLRYRSPAQPWRGGCSLREAESGCAPDRAVPFLCFAKEKEPKERRPDGGGRPRANCSAVLGVWGLAQNSLRGLRPLRSDNRAKSVVDARLRARPQTPVLLDASHGAQEQYGRLLRKLSLSKPRFASARSARCSSCRCAARRIWCTSPPSDELSSAGLCSCVRSTLRNLTSRRLSERRERSEQSELGASCKDRAAQGSPRIARAEEAGSLSLPPFFVDTKKGGRPPGRNPGAASRSEQDSHAHAGTNGAGLRYLSLSGRWCAKASGGAKQAMTQRTQGAATCPQS